MKAPSEQSAKRPVARIREIPGLEKKAGHLYQDPRFDTALGKADLKATRRNYQFLDKYRENEIQELRATAAKERDLEKKNLITKAIQSQESRLETFQRRDQEAEVLSRIGSKHMSRAKKRELILKDRFEKMKPKDAARLVERRRRKIAQKQKKLLPERR